LQAYEKNYKKISQENAKNAKQEKDNLDSFIKNKTKENEDIRKGSGSDIEKESKIAENLKKIEEERAKFTTSIQSNANAEAYAKQQIESTETNILKLNVRESSIAFSNLNVSERRLKSSQALYSNQSGLNDLNADMAVMLGTSFNLTEAITKQEAENVKLNEKRSKLMDDLEAQQSKETRGSEKFKELELKIQEIRKEKIDSERQILEMKRKEFDLDKRILGNQTSLLSARKSYIDSLITKGNIEGGVSRGDVQGSINQAVTDNAARKAMIQKALQSAEVAKNAVSESTLSEYYTNSAASKGKYISPEEAKKMAKESLQSGEYKTKIQTEQVELEKELNLLNKERSDIVLSILKQDQARLELIGQEVSLADSMISMMDNYAIGIGASVEMRMRSVEASMRELDVVKENVKLAEDMVKKDPKNIEAQKALNELKQKELSITSSIADKTKAMRDGWISAISASTQGQGMITKVMIDQNKNLGLGLKYLKTTMSNVSGGTSRDGTRVGETQSQKYSVDQSGNLNILGGSGIGYTSDADKMFGVDSMRMSQDVMSGNRSGLMNSINQNVALKARAAMQGGGALGSPGSAGFGAYFSKNNSVSSVGASGVNNASSSGSGTPVTLTFYVNGKTESEIIELTVKEVRKNLKEAFGGNSRLPN
jgi:hypothetical protein